MQLQAIDIIVFLFLGAQPVGVSLPFLGNAGETGVLGSRQYAGLGVHYHFWWWFDSTTMPKR